MREARPRASEVLPVPGRADKQNDAVQRQMTCCSRLRAVKFRTACASNRSFSPGGRMMESQTPSNSGSGRGRMS